MVLGFEAYRGGVSRSLFRQGSDSEGLEPTSPGRKVGTVEVSIPFSSGQ